MCIEVDTTSFARASLYKATSFPLPSLSSAFPTERKPEPEPDPMGEEKKIPEPEKKVPDEEPEKKKVPEDSDKKVLEETKPPPEETPKPEPPPEILMRVYMHCEGCARKVRRCLKGFDGVEEVITDCKTHKVVVKGEKADPMKVLERVQKKTHRQVELLSPIPPPKQPSEEDKKAEEKETPKPEEKKPEPKVVTVVLKVHMHCEACALGMKKRIERMKEVEEATPDLKSSEVSVKGTFTPLKLVEYIHKRTGKHAIIVKQDPPPPEDDKAKDGNKDEKKTEDEANKGDENKGGEEGKGSGKADSVGNEAASGPGEDEAAKAGVEVKRNEYYFQNYPPRYAMEMHDAYPPQLFSDENPNACSIM